MIIKQVTDVDSKSASSIRSLLERAHMMATLALKIGNIH